MNIPQTTVAATQTIGTPGEIADFHSAADAAVDSVVNTDTVDLAFGIFVVNDAANYPRGVKLPSAQNQILRGIVTHGHSFERKTELFSDGITPNTVFGALQRGRAFVTTLETVTPADHVRVQMIAEGGFPAGSLRKTASAGKTIDITPMARWMIGAGAAGVAKLEYDLNNIALATAD